MPPPRTQGFSPYVATVRRGQHVADGGHHVMAGPTAVLRQGVTQAREWAGGIFGTKSVPVEAEASLGIASGVGGAVGDVAVVASTAPTNEDIFSTQYAVRSSVPGNLAESATVDCTSPAMARASGASTRQVSFEDEFETMDPSSAPSFCSDTTHTLRLAPASTEGRSSVPGTSTAQRILLRDSEQRQEARRRRDAKKRAVRRLGLGLATLDYLLSLCCQESAAPAFFLFIFQIKK